VEHFIFLLVLLNPFSQALYLFSLLKRLPPRKFAKIHLKASLLAFGVFGFFAVSGKLVFHDILQIRYASLQIFGGLIMLNLAYRYFAVGPGSNLLFQKHPENLPSQIALPYIIGAGTLWQSVIIGRVFRFWTALGIIAGVLAVNWAFLLAVQWAIRALAAYKKTIVGEYFGLLMRTNALFIGAIGVDMLISGIQGSLK
jgi:small neutral amino acid transporter SnatA (MarC family)